MTENIIIGILILVILVSLYLLMQFKKIRTRAYNLFLKAEHILQKGPDKMDYVVRNIYVYLPITIKIFINEETLQIIIQKMFDEIKDLLDDGKFNNSVGGE